MVTFAEENVLYRPNLTEFQRQLSPCDPIFHQDKQLGALDGKHEGNKMQRGKQTRRAIYLRKLLIQVDQPYRLAKRTSFFLLFSLRTETQIANRTQKNKLPPVK